MKKDNLNVGTSQDTWEYCLKVKSTQTCRLTVLSTDERLSGTDVEFNITFVSWPVYTTIPETTQNTWFVCLLAWGLTALSAQIGYIVP